MRKKLVSGVVLVIVLFLNAGVALAAIPPSTWSGRYDTIAQVNPSNSGLAVILSTETWQGAPLGACNGGRQFYIAATDPNYEIKARALLAAHFAGREVSIWWDTSDSCQAHINRFVTR